MYALSTPLLVWFTKVSLLILPLLVVLFSLTSTSIKRKRAFYLGCILGVPSFVIIFLTALLLIALVINPSKFVANCFKDALGIAVTVVCFALFSLLLFASLRCRDFFYGTLFGMMWLVIVISPPLVNMLIRCDPVTTLLLLVVPIYLIPLIYLDYKKPEIIKKICRLLD